MDGRTGSIYRKSFTLRIIKCTLAEQTDRQTDRQTDVLSEQLHNSHTTIWGPVRLYYITCFLRVFMLNFRLGKVK